MAARTLAGAHPRILEVGALLAAESLSFPFDVHIPTQAALMLAIHRHGETLSVSVPSSL
jgi:hypothetical protein